MLCPSCHAPMAGETLDGHLGRSVTIDICASCQAFWFDHRESLQLSPRATLQLFRVVGTHAAARRQQLSVAAKCPRCGSRLVRAQDFQRNVRFQYLRCPHDHGRLTAFIDFLREKNFIRPLSGEQIEALRKNVQTVNCSNCGGPIDLANRSSCGHCGSPLSILDLRQTDAVITQLQQADKGGVIDPTLPLRLEQARREVDAAFAGIDGRSNWFGQDSRTDLVAAGLKALSRWLTDRL